MPSRRLLLFSFCGYGLASVTATLQIRSRGMEVYVIKLTKCAPKRPKGLSVGGWSWRVGLLVSQLGFRYFESQVSVLKHPT